MLFVLRYLQIQHNATEQRSRCGLRKIRLLNLIRIYPYLLFEEISFYYLKSRLPSLFPNSFASFKEIVLISAQSPICSSEKWFFREISPVARAHFYTFRRYTAMMDPRNISRSKSSFVNVEFPHSFIRVPTPIPLFHRHIETNSNTI